MRLSAARLTRALFAFWLAAVSALAAGALPPGLDGWVARAMRQFEVPGMAISIVKDGEMAFAKGYGVRKLGEPAPVNAHTLFGIASNTKAFTAAAVAILVDEGKLKWDDPVQKHLPGFQLYDPWVTRELTVRDTLCHRSGLGLGAGDLLFWPDTDVTREQVLAAARFIRPASSLRSRYAYNNLMFVVAGEVVAAVGGKPWDDFVRERIFTPLGMTETRIGPAGQAPDANAAAPHSRGWRLEGTLEPIPGTRDETWAAAAGIRSNVTDLSRWVLAQLAGGDMGAGRRLFSAGASREMWAPQIHQSIRPMTGALEPLTPRFSAYGLGWSLRDYHGRKMVSHGGALTGMVSTVVMLPEEKLGVIVLTNQEESGAFNAVAHRVLDHYLGRPETDWIAAYEQSRKDLLARAGESERKQAAARHAASKPSLAPSSYAARYEDAWYGAVDIREEAGKLVLSMTRTPAMTGDLSHWQYDTFLVRWRDKTVPDALITFTLNARGEIAQASMEAVSQLADFSFDYQDLLLKPARSR
jgi:CubicO group peptidase (beta-lactamase class C family)